MKKTIFPQDQDFWYLKRQDIPPLRTNREVDVVVIGGGMAGLTAAQAFARKGKKVILLEAFYCGSGASGKSSGFILANGEVSLSQFIQRYGTNNAQTIWDAIQKQGIDHIRANIIHYQIDCDYREADALEVASSAKDVAMIVKESENLAAHGYPTKFIQKEDIPQLVGTTRYFGGVIYTNSFGLNPYKYCQAMKDILIKQGVEIFEETPVLSIHEHMVTTLQGVVKAGMIINCTDRFIPQFNELTKEIYHVQNFLLISQPLSKETIQRIFPQKPLMIWDTDPVYQFYRLSGDRLLLGGGSPWNAYDSSPTYHCDFIHKKLTTYIAETFPQVDIQFEQMWPGLIGTSKDVAPIAGRDKDIPSLYYIGAAAGLSLAAMLGNYCADHMIDGSDTLQDFFSPYRKFPIDGFAQTILGTKVSFFVSHWISGS